jgi:hypothetical protein
VLQLVQTGHQRVAPAPIRDGTHDVGNGGLDASPLFRQRAPQVFLLLRRDRPTDDRSVAGGAFDQCQNREVQRIGIKPSYGAGRLALEV